MVSFNLGLRFKNKLIINFQIHIKITLEVKFNVSYIFDITDLRDKIYLILSLISKA